MAAGRCTVTGMNVFFVNIFWGSSHTFSAGQVFGCLGLVDFYGK